MDLEDILTVFSGGTPASSGTSGGLLDWITNNPTKVALLAGLGGGLAGLYGGSGTVNQRHGYQGGIPSYTANRTPIAQVDVDRRPGSAGRRYFSDTTFTPKQTLASGGIASVKPKGMYLGGKTDGMADRVPATINGSQPAQLSDGEFVIPADVVSHLGNGNSEAGADVLFRMMEQVRRARTGRPTQGRQINPNKYVPGGK